MKGKRRLDFANSSTQRSSLDKPIARWGFLIAGIAFLLVGVVPVARGQALNPAFFVLGIAFILLGAIIRRRGVKAGS